MKRFFLLSITTVLIIESCTNPKEDANQHFLPNQSIEDTIAKNKANIDTLEASSDTLSKQTDKPSIEKTEPNQMGDFSIVPGKSIGKAILEMEQQAMLSLLGEPSKSDAAMGTYVFTWLGKTRTNNSELNIVTGYADSNMVKRNVKLLRTTSPYFATDNGVMCKQYYKEVLPKFPKMKFLETYESENHKAKIDLFIDVQQGIIFEFLNYGHKMLVGMQVVPKGTSSPKIKF